MWNNIWIEIGDIWVGEKCTIDYIVFTNDGLTAINNETGKAILAFRGTKATKLRDWRENHNYGTTQESGQ